VGAECGCRKLAAGRSQSVDREGEMTDKVHTRQERPVKTSNTGLMWEEKEPANTCVTCWKQQQREMIFPEEFWVEVHNFAHHIHQAHRKGCCPT